ncbi:hypothetical protein Taro_011928, partial [Colocasia esculenta]|nr:hypothetical protein [Colocasia esculenta]
KGVRTQTSTGTSSDSALCPPTTCTSRNAPRKKELARRELKRHGNIELLNPSAGIFVFGQVPPPGNGVAPSLYVRPPAA